jgi:hypothetical protein
METVNIPWTQEEINLRYLDLFIECLNKPMDELFVNDRIQITLPNKYVHLDPSHGACIKYNDIVRGYVDKDFIIQVVDVTKDDLFEYMDTERLMLIKEKYRRFRKKYILETHADILYEKMKQETEKDE